MRRLPERRSSQDRWAARRRTELSLPRKQRSPRRTLSPPANASSGFTINGVYYDIATTASFTGHVKLTLPYDQVNVSDTFLLHLYHFDSAANTWVDVTTTIDISNHTVSGEVYSFSWLAVGTSNQKFSGFKQPINTDGTSIFKLGRTVPVKFSLTDLNNATISTTHPNIYVSKVTNNITGKEQEVSSTNTADSGNTFRYDSSSEQYIFNLGTKTLTQGTWQIRVLLDSGISHTVRISLQD